jgi:hypothetical protein
MLAAPYSTRPRAWLVAGMLERPFFRVFSVPFLASEARPATGYEGAWHGLVKKQGDHDTLSYDGLAGCSISDSRRPAAIAYLIVARTASLFGAHGSGFSYY